MAKKRKKKIGLALGSGAARGMAHIGVLKVFEEEGIEIDFIAGTSAGALIGALYAAGVSAARMEEVARELDWRRLAGLLDPTLPTSGIIDGKKMSRFIADLLPVHTFEELRIPLAVTATDIQSGEGLFIKKGNLLEALRAALAFPGIFNPVRFGDRYLVDGGLCNPVPVDIVKQMGADTVIGVCTIPEPSAPNREAYLPLQEPQTQPAESFFDFFNASNIEKRFKDIWRSSSGTPKPSESKGETENKPPRLLKIFAQSIIIMENEINALRMAGNSIDLLIRPKFNNLTLLEFHRASEAIEAGEKAARDSLTALKSLT